MAGPYLKSGETIVLTTDRVFIDDAEYDLILTSQRLALVDSAHIADQPQVIPFATIVSVKGGMTPAREPVVTLTVLDPEGTGETRALDLVFSQQPYEDRAAECDLWVKKLIEHIVSVRQEPREGERPQAVEKPRGIQPSVRRFIAPDVPLPHAGVGQSRRPSGELLSAMQGSAWENDPETTGNEVTGDRAGSPPPEFPPSGEIAPTTPEAGEETPVPVPDREDRDGSDYREEIIRGPELPEEMPVQSAVPATPFKELVPDQHADSPTTPLPVLPGEQPAGLSGDIEELSRQIEETEPVLAEDPGETRPEEPGPVGIPGNVIFPVLSGTSPDTASRTAAPPGSHKKGSTGKLPPATPPGTKKITVAAVLLAAVVLLVLIGAVAILTLPPILEQEYGPGLLNQTPAITPLPVTTVSPAGGVPDQGVWIKVMYNGTYYGKYGTPGSLIEVRGSGENVYPVKYGNALVQAGFQKLDLSGNNLTVEVYNNGTLITRAFKTIPGGEVDILVNSTTGKPPFVPGTTVAV